jgi:hypothetical protein
MRVVIAVSPTRSQLAKIAASTLVHVTDPSRISSIIVDKSPKSVSSIGENCTVSLKAGQGWNIAPFRLLRDYSVLDMEITNLKNWGRYTYFFVGEPSRWAILKNLTRLRKWEDLCVEFAVIRISGSAILSQAGCPIFYRADDDAVVVRGDFTGPAAVTPPP